MTAAAPVRIGLAGWSEAVSRRRADFPAGGASALSRYAAVFDFVEINASFYRSFPMSNYAKWAGETPADFRFSVKMPRLITHFTRLKNPDLLGDFFGVLAGLGDKLAAVLVQLPPSLVFDPSVAASFFDALRARYDGAVVCEPRHASWDGPEPADLLEAHCVGRVRTEIPAPAKEQGPARTPVYLRLHGAPRRYHSAYTDGQLAQLAEFLRLNPQRERFVVFDNTASGAAVCNALALRERLAFAAAGKHV